MRYSLIVRPEAEQDIEESFNWYEDQERDLGKRFVLAVRSGIDAIGERRLSFPVVWGKTRRCIINRFPFSLFFIVSELEIVVTACIHQRRHPRVWKSRAKKLD